MSDLQASNQFGITKGKQIFDVKAKEKFQTMLAMFRAQDLILRNQIDNGDSSFTQQAKPQFDASQYFKLEISEDGLSAKIVYKLPNNLSFTSEQNDLFYMTVKGAKTRLGYRG